MATLLLTLCLAHADPDSDYLDIYNVICRADQLAAKGEVSRARDYYIKAQQELEAFQQTNPNWNHQILSYRFDYLSKKIAETTEQPVPPENKPSAAAKKTAAPASKSPVKLLDAGSEPRIVLHLHPTVGDQKTIKMTMQMAMDMSVAGKQMPSMNIPAMITTMTVEVKSIAANGDIHYGMTFDDASVADDTNALPAVASAMKTALGNIRGMKATGTMSSQGVVKALQMKLPPGAAPQLAQAMGQMKESFSSSSIPFPTEAVGAGAKWTYSTKIKNQGMTIEQTATYELVSVDGDQVTLNSTISQNAAHQQVQNPAMPGLKMDLTRLTGTGTGKSTLDLASVMPASSTLTENMEMAMSMNVGQQKQEMTMKMNMDISLDTK